MSKTRWKDGNDTEGRSKSGQHPDRKRTATRQKQTEKKKQSPNHNNNNFNSNEKKNKRGKRTSWVRQDDWWSFIVLNHQTIQLTHSNSITRSSVSITQPILRTVSQSIKISTIQTLKTGLVLIHRWGKQTSSSHHLRSRDWGWSRNHLSFTKLTADESQVTRCVTLSLTPKPDLIQVQEIDIKSNQKKTLYSSNQIKSQVSFLENQNSKLSFFLFFFDSHSIQIHQLTRLGTVIFFFLIHFQFTCGWESKPTEKRSKFDTIYIELSQRESWHQFELRERVERKVQTV